MSDNPKSREALPAVEIDADEPPRQRRASISLTPSRSQPSVSRSNSMSMMTGPRQPRRSGTYAAQQQQAPAGGVSKKALWIAISVFMGVQIAVAGVVVYRHKAKRKARRLAALQTGDPYALYGRARALATAGKRAEAYALLARIETSTNPQVKQMAASLRTMLDGQTPTTTQPAVPGATAKVATPQVGTGSGTTTGSGTGSGTADTPPTPVVATTLRPTRTHKGRKRWRWTGRRSHKTPKPTPAPTPVPTAVQPAQLFVSSTPTAKIFVDGAFKGFTPQNGISVEAGTRKLLLRAEGHRDYRKTFRAKVGEKSVVEVKLEPLQAPTKPPPAAVAVKKPEPNTPPRFVGPIPSLRLPQKVVVPAYRNGKPSAYPRAVCRAVEAVVSKAMKRSARGTTAALQRYLYGAASSGDKITLYPRVMGYLIAQSLAKNKSNIGGLILNYHKTGRMASLADANWRP